MAVVEATKYSRDWKEEMGTWWGMMLREDTGKVREDTGNRIGSKQLIQSHWRQYQVHSWNT